MSSVLGIALPPQWSATRLKHVTAALNRGSAPNYADAGPVRAVSQASNQPGGINWERTRFHDFHGIPSTLKGHLHPDDLLINSTGTGTLGRVGYFTGSPDGLPCMADSHVTLARTRREQLNPRYAYYWLTSKPFQEYVYSALVVGATNQIELNRDRLADAPVPLPQLSEQLRIAEFLDIETAKIDHYVSLYTKLQCKLREKHQSITESLLLHGNETESVPPSSGGAPFPSSFHIGRLKHAATRIDVGIAEAATHAYATTGSPLIRSMNIRPNRLELDDLLYIEPWFAERNKSKYVRAGDILTVRTGNAGISAVVPQKMDRSQTFTQLITTPKKGFSAEYFCQFLNSRVGREYFKLVSWGSAQRNISVPLLANTPVPIPQVHIQEAIASRINQNQATFDALDTKISTACELAAERRQTLITAAVTGQFDVSTASGRNVTEGVSA
ncbi:restriction endonuclease subunit S [Streptomyces sp. NPDC057148]|uniref:restriction endonuclease subunit S n=1 Tax=unclassified Streptomyces TaxID=2593676 RepID=UPI003628D18C